MCLLLIVDDVSGLFRKSRQLLFLYILSGLKSNLILNDRQHWTRDLYIIKTVNDGLI